MNNQENKNSIQMTANEAHEKFEHADNNATCAAAKKLGIVIVRGNS